MNFRQAVVWQTSMRLAKAVCRDVVRMRPLERNTLGIQMIRASTSVPSNIAEGWSRDSPKDKARFLSISQGSLDELRTQLILCRELEWLPEARVAEMLAGCDRTGKMLTTLRRYLRSRHTRPQEPKPSPVTSHQSPVTSNQ